MNQRKDRRFKQWNKAVIRVTQAGQISPGPAEVKVITYDLSLGGARIHSEEPFEVGAVLRLQIELVRSRETINLEGQVKWIKRNESEHVFEMGLEFLHSNSQAVMGLMKNLHGENF
jgi:c-di-GMP-binding flagellar brake protein YcgR